MIHLTDYALFLDNFTIRIIAIKELTIFMLQNVLHPGKLLFLFLILISNSSCSKDSDIFNDYIQENQQEILENQDDSSQSTPSNNGDAIVLTNLKAFPSAQGHGVNITTGGKGGKIFYVTTLSGDPSIGSYDSVSDTHSGSLNYAIRHEDPGYIVFRVSGVIDATDYSWYVAGVGKGNKTIMGGTAPYPGIVFHNNRFKLWPGDGNWIIRGMTFLGGTISQKGQDDAIQIEGITELILSDNTFGWAGDEAFSLDDGDNFSVQRNVGLECHPEHNTGSIFKTDVSVSGLRRSGSAHNNGYFHIKHRFPNFRGLDSDYLEGINNFAYNYQTRFESHNFQLNLNDINNYYKPGPRSSTGFDGKKKWNASDQGSPYWLDDPKIYTSGNIIEGIFENPNENNEVLWEQHITAKGFISGDDLPKSFFTNNMHPLGLDVKIKSTQDVYTYNIVGKNIGARYYMNELGVRQKYIHPFVDNYFEDAINGTDFAFLNNNSLFTTPNLPPSKEPYDDSDKDGMADNWEKEHGLEVGIDDKESVKEVWVIDGSTFINNAGYTNIQIFNDYVHGGFVVLTDENKM